MIPNLPTRAELHRKALIAAASVVLALGAGACDLIDPAPEEGADTALADTGALDTGGDTDLLDTGGDPGGDPGLDLSARSDCSVFAIERLRSACCLKLLMACEEEHPDDLRAKMDCAFGGTDEEGTGCIPWGPSAPPTFSGRALA